MNNNMLSENNVSYTRDEKTALELGLKLFEYKWMFCRDEDRVYGIRNIYCRNMNDLLKLLNLWNSKGSNFKYWTI